ncbi:MBL fold metallo-hydrolase [Reinekea blandensis]|uniref:Metal-dependent Hydrolase of the beta-lactamase superfamily III n=1 Tax=Reinekea blandensis MED297 TaxID=314283 RepID=A4BBQ0_9GAMM|nr:MBL fold metallo-hydrolase [Reinekea blandensis]EAR10385.1 Metal-dependent Hydrolase of the beta-lactamase superfamily III [Reinekea sp. MED297] [Reinekea blandensis MED297]
MKQIDDFTTISLSDELVAVVLGAGNAYDTDRHNASLLLRKANQSVLIDCGPWVTKRLLALIGPEEINEVYFTHAHPDHCLGLTTLTNWMSSNRRQQPLLIHCIAEQKPLLQTLVNFGCWPEREHTFNIEWRDIEPFGELAGYDYETAATKHSVDNRSLHLTLDENRSVFYSGDGKLTAEGAALAAQSDVVFIECEQVRPCRSHNSLEEVFILEKKPSSRWFLYHVASDQREAIAHRLLHDPHLELLQESFVHSVHK